MSNGMWQAQVGDREQWEAMRCENHHDRAGILAVDLPNVGVKRYMCDECVLAFDKRMSAIPSNDVAGWMRELRQGYEDRRRDMLDAYPSQPLMWKDKK